MATRSSIIAGKTVIVVQVQESVDRALNQISGQLNKFSNKVNRLGLELFSGGLFGTLVTSQTLKNFKDFEDQILFLSTKLQTSERQFAEVVETIRDLGRTTSFTATQVAQGATALAQAGLNAKEVTDTLLPALDLARGAQIELSAAGAILVNTIRSYGLETSKANEVASQFIVASRLGTLEVLDLKESIKEVLGTARSLNIDLPTTLALITQLAERSLKGTKAGTSLNTALLNLAGKKKQLKELLGIELPDNIDGDQFIKFLEDLYNRINRLGNLQRTAVLQRLFNIRGGRAITGLDDIAKVIRLQTAIREAGDEARRSAQIMDSGLGGSVRIAASALESLAITTGKIVSTRLVPFIDAIPALTASLEQLAVANEGLVVSLLLTPPALVGLGAGLLALSFLGGKVAGVLKTLAGTIKGLGDFALRGLNGQLVVANKALDALFKRQRREGKGSSSTKRGGLVQSIDEGLSRLLLAPQKIKVGRNAGKIRPTSFFGRVGATSLVGTGAAVRKVLKIFDILAPSTTKVQSAFLGLIKILDVSRNAVNKLPPALQPLLRLTVSLISLVKSLSNPFVEFTGRLNTGVIALRNIVLQFRILRQAIPQHIASIIQVTKSTLTWTNVYPKLIALSARIGDVFKKLTPDPRKFGINKTALFFGSLGKFIKNIRTAFARGDLSKVLDTKPLLTLAKSFSVSGLGKGLGLIINLFGSLFKSIPRALAIFTRVDYVRGILNMSRGLFTFTKGLFSVLNGIRRFVFTFSGFLTIVELLIFFGPKIPFIRDAFVRLGKGFADAGRTIGSTFKDLGPVFKLFSASFGQLLEGNGETGIFSLTKAFKLLGTVVKSNLVIAFNQVKEAIAPLFDTLRLLASGIIETFTLIGSLIGATFSNIGAGIQGITGGGAGSLLGSIQEFFKSTFTKENLKLAFAGIGGAVVSIFKNINSLFQRMFTAFTNTLAFIESAIAKAFTFISNAALTSAEKLSNLGFSGIAKSILQSMSEAAVATSDSLESSAAQNREAVSEINNGFANNIDRMDTAFGKFLSGLNTIFGKSTEDNAKNDQQRAAADKAAAQAEAKRLAEQARVNTGFTSFGKQIGSDPLGLLGVIGRQLENSLSNQLNVTDIKNKTLAAFGIEGKPIFDFNKIGNALLTTGQSFFNIGKSALTKGAGGLDQRTLIKEQIKQLRRDQNAAVKQRQENRRGLSIRLLNGEDVNDIITSADKGFARDTQTRRRRIEELQAQLRTSPVGQQTASLRNIVSATVGTFRQTRGNLLRVAGGKSIEQQQLSTLQEIRENTGGANSSLQELVNTTGPLVFQ